MVRPTMCGSARRGLFYVCICSLAVALGTCGPAQAKMRFEGNVFDAADPAKPIPSVEVSLLDPSTGEKLDGFSSTTDASGAFAIDDIPDGEYKVLYDATGPSAAYVSELFDEIPCDQGNCDRAALGEIVDIFDSGDVSSYVYDEDLVLHDGSDDGSDGEDGIEDTKVLSGSWYNPDRDGEGFHVEILPGGEALVIWFTYPGASDPAQAKQSWILGNGPVEGSRIVIENAYKGRGPTFGDDYDKNDFFTETWGDIEFEFSGENEATVTFDGADGAGSTEVVRLTALSSLTYEGSLSNGFSGAWYDPATNGQGWFVEIISNTEALVYWFTYDQNGNQAWNLGVGQIFGNTIAVPESYAGKGSRFGNEFDADEVALNPFGAFSLTFSDCNNGELAFYAQEGALGGSYPIKRLTALEGYNCGPGAIPGPADVRVEIMPDPSDPILKRYELADGGVLDLLGSYNPGNESSSASGAVMNLANGVNLRINFPDDPSLYEIIDEDSGTRLVFKGDPTGFASLTVFDADGQSSTTIPWPTAGAADNQTQSGDSLADKSGASPERIFDPGGGGSAGPVAEISVEYCGEPTDKARVDFIVGNNLDNTMNPSKPGFDPSRVIIVPGFPVGGAGNWVYEGYLPSNEELISEDNLLKICKSSPEEWNQFCDSLSDPAVTALANRACAGLVNPYAVLACYAAVNGPNLACKTQQVICDKGLPRFNPDVWAKITMPGLSGNPRIQGFNNISPSTIRTELRGIVLPGGALVTDRFVSPSQIVAGDSFDLRLETTCIFPGLQLTAVKDNGLDYQCTVDDAGQCQFQNIKTSSTDRKLTMKFGDDGCTFETCDLGKQEIELITGLGKAEIIKPAESAVLPNRCSDEDVFWEFEWKDVPGASDYIVAWTHPEIPDEGGYVEGTSVTRRLTNKIEDTSTPGVFGVKASNDQRPGYKPLVGESDTVQFKIASCDTPPPPPPPPTQITYSGSYKAEGTIRESDYCAWEAQWSGTARAIVSEGVSSGTMSFSGTQSYKARDLNPDDLENCSDLTVPLNFSLPYMINGGSISASAKIDSGIRPDPAESIFSVKLEVSLSGTVGAQSINASLVANTSREPTSYPVTGSLRDDELVLNAQ